MGCHLVLAATTTVMTTVMTGKSSATILLLSRVLLIYYWTLTLCSLFLGADLSVGSCKQEGVALLGLSFEERYFDIFEVGKY